MKVKEVTTTRTYYVTMETVNGDFHYRTDWTGVWEVLVNGGLTDEAWEPVDDTEELQQTLTNYWKDGNSKENVQIK